MTDDYSQPDFYRFNQDSTALIRWILHQNLRPQSILDLGAGSGIIGIELARELKAAKLCLVELQQEYLPHLRINAEKFLSPETIVVIQISSFSNFAPSMFDLIVCNPPYYLPGQGELAADRARAIARSFIKDSWKVLLEKISQSLRSEGQAFLVVKQNEQLLQTITSEGKKVNLEMTISTEYRLKSSTLLILRLQHLQIGARLQV